jgi:hypothetical protein
MDTTIFWLATAMLAALALGFAAGWFVKRGSLLRQLEATEKERQAWRAIAFDLSAKNQRLCVFADAALRSGLERWQQ